MRPDATSSCVRVTFDEDRAIAMHAEGKSVREISVALGVAESTLRWRLKRRGIEFLGRPAFSDEWRANMRASRRAWAEKHAKQKILRKSGYVTVARGEGSGRDEHVLVAESLLGRRLQDGEVVHHINGVRSDNRPSNLMVLTNAGHAALHRWWDNVTNKRRERDQNGRFR